MFDRWILVFLLLVVTGCGSTQNRDATEQLMTSDAVDRSVSGIDFRSLSGEKVYFDTTYLKNFKGVGFVNAEYITSSLRQQLVAARCLLQDKKDDANYIVEARIGTLGMDRHEVTYGMPANNFLSAASSLVPNSPPLPTLPELSLAKRNEQFAAAKIAAFAYHRETGEPVWQSGVAPTRSTARDLWVLGAGPFQAGEIYDGTQFAGKKLGFSFAGDDSKSRKPPVDYHKPARFPRITHKKLDELREEPTEKTKEKSRPKSEPKAEATKKPSPTSNPLKSSTKTDQSLRMRVQFDESPPQPGYDDPPGLYRLDPEPSRDKP